MLLLQFNKFDGRNTTTMVVFLDIITENANICDKGATCDDTAPVGENRVPINCQDDQQADNCKKAVVSVSSADTWPQQHRSPH